jgi:hypothetical protein
MRDIVKAKKCRAEVRVARHRAHVNRLLLHRYKLLVVILSFGLFLKQHDVSETGSGSIFR